MTITFPRDLPEPSRIAVAEFRLDWQQAIAPTRGGKVQAVDLGVPLWAISYATATLNEAQGIAWEAWLESLGGSVRPFRAWQPLRRYAYAYRRTGYAGLVRAAGGAFTGIGVAGQSAIVSVGGSLDAVTIDGLPAGFALTVGDMLSWDVAGKQALHRVTEAGVASGAGVATVGVAPLVRPSPAVGAPVALERPWCRAILDPGSVRASWQVGRLTQVSFSATQVI